MQALVYLAVGLAAGAEFDGRRRRRPRAHPALGLRSPSPSARIGMFVAPAHRLRRGGAGHLPALLRLPLLLLDGRCRCDLIQTDWFPTVATINPVSYMIEGIRRLLITAGTGEALALGFGIALASSALVMLAAVAAPCARRLVRT